VKVVVRSEARKDILRQFEYYLIEKDAETAAIRTESCGDGRRRATSLQYRQITNK